MLRWVAKHVVAIHKSSFKFCIFYVGSISVAIKCLPQLASSLLVFLVGSVILLPDIRIQLLLDDLLFTYIYTLVTNFVRVVQPNALTVVCSPPSLRRTRLPFFVIRHISLCFPPLICSRLRRVLSILQV